MPIVIHCICGRQLRARDEQAGRRCKCPNCGRSIEVPYPVATIVPRDEDDTPAPVGEIAPVGNVAPVREIAPVGHVVPVGEIAQPTIDARHAMPAAYRPPTEDAPAAELPCVSKDVHQLEATPRAHVYWLLLLTILPLVLVTFTRQPTIEELVQRTLETHPEAKLRYQEMHQTDSDDDDNSTAPAPTLKPLAKPTTRKVTVREVDYLLQVVRGHKVDGALLSRYSWMHWPIALVASVLMFGFCIVAIPADDTTPRKILGAGVFTATLGVGLLIIVQFFGAFCCIGLWYIAALHPDAPFGPSLLGFIFGVGVCEETIKCLPVLWRLRHDEDFGWRDACLIGMASGAGFGISEGIHYCVNYYNGIYGADIYFVRFLSTTALHIMLSAACGILIFRKRKHLAGWSDPFDSMITLIAIMLVPIFLHALYDTMSKKEMEIGALCVWLASFAWLAWLITDSRRREDVTPPPSQKIGPKLVRTEKGTRFIGA